MTPQSPPQGKTLKRILQQFNTEQDTVNIIAIIKEWLEQKHQEAIKDRMLNYVLCITELMDELSEELTH